MARILIASTATPGHVFPLLKIAGQLVRHGHAVTVLSGRLFRQDVEKTGAQFQPFDERIDFDYRHLESHFPLRATLPPGPAQMALALKNFFADAMPLQDQDLRRLISQLSPDLVLIENTFYGALPLLLGPKDQRPKVACIGVTPLTLSSRDSIFYGPRIPPAVLPDDLSRSTLVEPSIQQLIDDVQAYFNATLSAHGHPPLQSTVTDSLILNVDRFLQLSTQAFDYARAELPETVQFVGPLNVKHPNGQSVAELFPGDERPLVVVTQGTLANADLNQLLLPTLRALADLPVKVLALTGGRETDAVAPQNARIIDFVSYVDVLPEASVFITNGGFGAINGALSHGVPVIVAGTGEDKAETAARVVWARCGINLGTSYPTEQAISEAVENTLQNPSFKANAQAIAEDFGRHDALVAIHTELGLLIAAQR